MSEQAKTSQRPADVYFFATCVVDQFFPGAGLDAITLLERAGIRVHFPEEQTCCGQPAYTSGFPDEARKVAAHQLTLFPKDWPVVVPSGSCAGMMKHHNRRCSPMTRRARRRPMRCRRASTNSPIFWSMSSAGSRKTRAATVPSCCIPPVPPVAKWASI